MRVTGTCYFCGRGGNWEVGMFAEQAMVKDRPKDWAAYFPSNMPALPKGCTFREEDMKKHGVVEAMACPRCCRKPTDSFIPPTRKER